jgi:hypothetical protein
MKHGSLLLALALTVAVDGAQRIRYEEIPTRIAPFGTTIKAYCITVTTLDGMVHRSGTIALQATQINLDSSAQGTIPSGQVARIEIRRGRRTIDFAFDTAFVALSPLVWCVEGGGSDPCVAAPFYLPVIAVAVASAPVTLAIDGIELLVPPKVYEIIH